MQQISNSAPASAIVVDPRRGLRPQGRKNPNAFSNLSRFWVLHRLWILRCAAGILCALLIAASFNARGGISQAVGALSAFMQGEFADAGLGINEIELTGQSLTAEGEIFSILGINDRTSIFSFDADLVRQQLLELPAVAEATVRKVYPNQVVVTLVEKQPVARWTVDDLTFVIDAQGEQIGRANSADGALPLVIGDGAADDAIVIIRALQRYPALEAGLGALSRLADRRWDMIYRSGLRVQLPEIGIAQALQKLSDYQNQYQLLDRDLKLIDLRVERMLAVRPAYSEEPSE